MSTIADFRVGRAPQRMRPSGLVQLSKSEPEGQLSYAGDSGRAASGDASMVSDSVLMESYPGRDDFDEVTVSVESTTDPVESHRHAAEDFVKGPSFLGGGAPIDVPLRELDEWLTEHDNRTRPQEIHKFLRGESWNIVQASTWLAVRQALTDSFVAAILADVNPAVRGELARLILVADLLEKLVEQPSPITTADDVFDHLRWSKIVLPKEIRQALNRRPRTVRRYGFSDYYVVRDEWKEYRLGEIAHIENVLAGEEHNRRTVRSNERETIELLESDTFNSEQRDTQTTIRLEMRDESQREMSLAAHVEGQVNVSAQYGPAKIEAHVGGSFDFSQSEATQRATKMAQESVARAVTKVESRVRESRSSRSLETFSEETKHHIKNTADDAEHVTGIYRWVDKVQRMQMFSFAHRFLVEFQVPEPATFLRWRRSKAPTDFANPAPPPLVVVGESGEPVLDTAGKMRPLAPTDLTDATYLRYAVRYQIGDIQPPPPADLAISSVVALEIAEAPTGTFAESLEDKTGWDLLAPGGGGADTGLTIPSGYKLHAWRTRLETYSSFYTNEQGVNLTTPRFRVTIGQDSVAATASSGGETEDWIATFSPSAGLDRPDLTGILPMTVTAVFVREVRAHVQLVCQRLASELVRWQLRSYEALVAAHGLMKARHDEERSSRQAGQGIAISGDSPLRNAEVVREELKRAVITLASDGRYPPAVDKPGVINPTTGPTLDLDDAAKQLAPIQFLEQAFEWENLSYVLYPYYWANKLQWAALGDLKDADPEFARFLRSGSARVVVPARPGFEDHVQMYLDLGVLWGGSNVPAIGDPDYLSIAEEIKAQRKRPRDGEPGEWWDVTLPTTLVALDSDSSMPKLNDSLTLGPPQPTPNS